MWTPEFIVTSPIEAGYIRLRQFEMPNSGGPEVDGEVESTMEANDAD
jgi:hypothetical protein